MTESINESTRQLMIMERELEMTSSSKPTV